MATPEGKIKSAIVKFLNTIPGMLVIPISTTGMYDVTRRRYRRSPMRLGTSDLLVCYRGRFGAIEVKTPKKYPTKEQREFLEDVKRAGGFAFVARSIEDVQRGLPDSLTD